jgi:hypothetical protein
MRQMARDRPSLVRGFPCEINTGANNVGSNEKSITLGRVFVPGGMPTITYNPREDLQLEQKVLDYTDERHRILSLSGPTKSGKTVLLRSVLQSPVWLSGGEISTLQDFHHLLADKLGVFTDEQWTGGDQDTSTDTTTIGGSLAPGGVGPRVDSARSDVSSSSRSRSGSRKRSIWLAAKQKLEADLPVIVVDDFHYITPDVQMQIVRGLKELIFAGLPVVLASVPHRAFDVVRVEKEMTGRVVQLSIDFWSESELIGIAEAGFEALNVTAPDEMPKRLAKESFGSPHLMQDFCLGVCKQNAIRVRQETTGKVLIDNWEGFFGGRASETSKMAFDLLARGPRQRSDRKERILKDGRVMDIYGVVLAAMAYTGPRTKLTYEELRAALRDLLDEPPQRHEVTRVLEEMSRIARDQIEGEPVVDYDDKLGTLYIADPFFAYFLRWGPKAHLDSD